MNDQYLESSEQLDRFFPASIHKIKLHIFKNISKCLIHGLIPFIYKNTCELCDNILGKDNIGIIIVNKCFVLHEEVIYVFREFFYIPTIEKLSFHMAHVSIIGSMED